LAAADEGTLIHDALEHDDPSNLESEEQMWAYHACKGHVQAIIDSCPGRHRIIREAKLTVKGLTYGYADVIVIDYTNKIIHVIDYKLGRMAVDHAEFNLQLHAYGVGALERFRSYNELHVHLIAPRIPDFTSAVFNRTIVDVTRARIQSIISEASSPFKQPQGGDHCGFCTNKPRCPVMNAAVTGVVRGAGYLELPEQFLPENILTPEDRSRSLLLARVIPDWCTLVKQINTSAAIEDGENIPGFSLRRRAGSVSVKDAGTVLEKTVRTLGFSHEDLLVSGTASVSISKLADLMRTERPIPEFNTKRDYVDALVELFGDAVSRGSEVVFLQKDRKLTDQELADQLLLN